jgi:hypothetical protein
MWCVCGVVCVVCVCGITLKINKDFSHKQHYKLVLVFQKQYVCGVEGTKRINKVLINVNVSRSSSSQYYCCEKKKMAAMAWKLQTKE